MTGSAMENKSEPRRVLSLIVDAAIAGDDAIVRNDADGLRRAIGIISGHVESLRKLALAGEVSHA